LEDDLSDIEVPNKVDMGEAKELGLIVVWGFQELYVFVGDFLKIFYVVIYGYWFATCVPVVWFEWMSIFI
jgi:hypothetical protein